MIHCRVFPIRNHPPGLAAAPSIMGKKDKKSKTAEQKARLAARQSKKVEQKEKKGNFKSADDSDADDIDLESVLEDYAKRVCLLVEEFLSLLSTALLNPCFFIFYLYDQSHWKVSVRLDLPFCLLEVS